MDNIAKKNLLYDFYGELLSEHQNDVYSAAIFDDMSYSELADEFGCTRQAAFDLIRRTNQKLEGYEKRLGLVTRFTEAKENNQAVTELLTKAGKYIENSDMDNKDKKELSNYLDQIGKISEEVFDNF